MSVIPVTCYQAKCDICGQLYEDAEGYGVTDDRAYALELATDAGWLQVRGTELRCPSCLNCARCGESPAWVGGHELKRHNQILCEDCEPGPARVAAEDGQ